MKRTIVCFLLPLILLSCENKKARLDHLQAENDSLRNYASEREELLGNTIESFNRIQENLDRIKEMENIITVSSSNSEKADTSRILNDIQAIYGLMEENKATIKKLQTQLNYTSSKLRKSDEKMKELEKMIQLLQNQINQKDQEIENLKQMLEDKNIHIQFLTAQVDSISAENQLKKEQIFEQDNKLNTVFIAYGTKDKLLGNNIIVKSGGFIGLGKTYKASDNLNHDFFIKVDKRKVTSIPLKCKNAELITGHPENSYEFIGTEKRIDSLSIKNPEVFWKNSRHLIILVE